jgi:hypothetical protein
VNARGGVPACAGGRERVGVCACACACGLVLVGVCARACAARGLTGSGVRLFTRACGRVRAGV